jgi:protein-L-isoaspartate(D-aspartate) O-methyltransferase
MPLPFSHSTSQRFGIALGALVACFALTAPAQTEDEFAQHRDQMVSRQIESRGVTDSATLAAMRAVPRHEFIPERSLAYAYGDHPVPIGHGQTISQPYIVGYMTELLELEEGDKVLEVGTGSGYQAAVLAEIIDDVHTVEIIPALARSAKSRLERLGYDKVNAKEADGYYIVTAAASHVPPPLVEQLAVGGRMIVPVGATPWSQNLILVTKGEEGAVRTRNLIPVRFVPLTGEGRD